MADIRANIARPVDKLSQLNDPGEAFKNPLQIEFIRQFVRLVRGALGTALDRDQAAPHFHLISAAGKVYRVTVADDGTLNSEYIRG